MRGRGPGPEETLRAAVTHRTLEDAARALGLGGSAMRKRMRRGKLRARWETYKLTRSRKRGAAKTARKRARRVLREASRLRGVLPPLWRKRIKRALGHIPERERARWAYLLP